VKATISWIRKPPTVTSNRLPNYLLIMGIMNEIAEQFRLKGKHSSWMGWKWCWKNSSGDPKYVRIPNCSENDYVTVLNCSLIREGEVVCRRPDSLVSRAAVRYSEGPWFAVSVRFSIKHFFKCRCFNYHGEKSIKWVKYVKDQLGGILFKGTADDSYSVELLSECKCCIALKSVPLTSN
jgi:hypothetical protein